MQIYAMLPPGNGIIPLNHTDISLKVAQMAYYAGYRFRFKEKCYLYTDLIQRDMNLFPTPNTALTANPDLAQTQDIEKDDQDE